MEIITSEYGKNSERIEGCAVRCGADVAITLCGGTKPHVGAVSMACYEPERDSATVSTITAYGHRDDVLSAACAKRAAKELKCTVTVSVGIHVDDADIKMIERLRENCTKCFEILFEKIED